MDYTVRLSTASPIAQRCRQRASRWLLAFGLLFTAATGRAAGVPIPAAGEPERISESRLLHRRIDLAGLEVYNPKAKAWRPYVVPKEKILVVNLWSKSCAPCLQEMPELARLAKQWSRRTDVELLVIATPFDEMSREAVEQFWHRRIYEAAPGESCPGRRDQMLASTMRNCDLELPDVEPLRAKDERLPRALGTERKPITLLVDSRGIVRHAFVGAVIARGGELTEAIDRLAAALRVGR